MQTKSEMINRIAELAEENAKLNAIIDGYQPKIQALKEENERLKNTLAIWENAVQKQTALKVVEVDKYRQTLQEIKAIADEDCEFCDDIGGCMDYECRKVRILDLITKAEEEWK